ncbi:SubName: Full=Uncharacterized protein {ECO:0000313/EMBL:CCA68699.1} [Serendipita indica DSM 11827]|nr:SubName: Full=Uncharacterized protein {ECO:0000313/EMBL:CCA68699.1} [Serendipita indica DSM 11827]
MDYKSQNSSNAQQALLKSSQRTYGSSSNANGAVAAESRPETLVEPPALPEGPMKVKQVFAAIAVLLSGGAKLVHVWLHIYRHEPDTNWFKPVDGMLIIFWIAAYALQLDYIFMLGHKATEEDPEGYDSVRSIANVNLPKFLFAHVLLCLWQIIKLPICAFICVTFTFFTFASMYTSVHRLWKEKHNYGRTASTGPSFLQGPMSAFLVFITIIHMPSTLIILITHYKPHANLDAIEWPLAWWILIVNVAGAHIATRRAVETARANEANSQLRAQRASAGLSRTYSRRGPKSVPVDLAALIALFWGTLAVAAGTGTVNYGPVSVFGYISALWQALALFGSMAD